jgi:hypothetical protein
VRPHASDLSPIAQRPGADGAAPVIRLHLAPATALALSAGGLALLLLFAALARVRFATGPAVTGFALILGVAAYPIAWFFELWSDAIVEELGLRPVAAMTLRLALAASLVQLILLLVYAQLVRRLESFRGAADSATAVLVMGTAFALVEALLAASGARGFSDPLGLRAATAVPALAAAAVPMAFCCRHAETGFRVARWMVLAWLLPALMHVAYNLPLALAGAARRVEHPDQLEGPALFGLTAIVFLAAVLIVAGFGSQDAEAATAEPNRQDSWPEWLRAVLLAPALWWVLALACGAGTAALFAASWGLVAGFVPDLGLAAYAIVPGALVAICVLMTHRVTEGLDALDAQISVRVEALRKRLFAVMSAPVEERIKRLGIPWLDRWRRKQ